MYLELTLFVLNFYLHLSITCTNRYTSCFNPSQIACNKYFKLYDFEARWLTYNFGIEFSVKGLKRVNIIMRRGGSALRRHMEKIIAMSKLGPDKFAKDLDERGTLSFIFT